MARELQAYQKAILDSGKRFQMMSQALKWEQESTFALDACIKNPQLRECTPASIKSAIYNTAATGLTLNPIRQLAYLVPRRPKQGEDLQCCLDIGYRGFIDVATRSGALDYVNATLVYSEDEFVAKGEYAIPHHLFDPFGKDRGEMIGVYCVAKVSSDNPEAQDYLVEFMSEEEVDVMRMASMMGRRNAGPWKTHKGEMWRKTVIKRAAKRWPVTNMSDDVLATAIDVDNSTQVLISDEATGDTISKDQIKELNGMIAEKKIDVDMFLKIIGVPTLDTIPLSRYQEAIDYLASLAAPA